MKRIMVLFAVAVSAVAFTGCNTIRGVGEDISAMGRALSDSTGTSGEAAH